MEKDEHPRRLYHGTPQEIHTTDRPFLDPHLASGYDEGDPQEAHVFATPDLLMASIFAFKNSDCIHIIRADETLVAVYDGSPPDPQEEHVVYEVPADGFEETTAYGVPTGKWAAVESNMPMVTDADGQQVAGIPLGEPVRRVGMRDLIEQDNLRVCIMTGVIDGDTYTAALSDAIRAGMAATFMREAIERGWLRDVTDIYLEE